MELRLKQPKNLAEIADIIGASIVGDVVALGKIQINVLTSIETATAGCITFLSNQLYKKYLPLTQASAIVLSSDDAKQCPPQSVALIAKDPRLALAKLLMLWGEAKPKGTNIHPSAVIGKNVELGVDVNIQAGVVIGNNCKIGSNTEIKANVTLYDQVTIGSGCTIHSGTVIGSDGFGYAVDTDGSWFKMLHLGGVVIGNNVEIGSNTSIDRGMIDDTVIGDQVIIDNLVQIGHNVTIGNRTAIAGCTGIAGSTSIGKNCLIGGASNIAGHITIGDRVHITGTSAVNHSLPEPGVYSSGFPAKENGAWRRNVARFMSLDTMAKRLKEIEKTLEKAMVGL